jgi:Uma2 family endonuclease
MAVPRAPVHHPEPTARPAAVIVRALAAQGELRATPRKGYLADHRNRRRIMATHRAPLDPDDVLDLPLPDGVSGYELVDGKLAPVSPASLDHGWLIVEVGRRLANFVEEQGVPGRVYADAGFVMRLPWDDRRLRGPDVAFVTEETLARFGDPGPRFARFVPELAVEIDVSGGRKPGGRQRIRDYLHAGVRLVWDIHPHTRSATVYRQDGSAVELSGADGLDGEDVVPGFLLPLATLFR